MMHDELVMLQGTRNPDVDIVAVTAKYYLNMRYADERMAAVFFLAFFTYFLNKYCSESVMYDGW
jgi:hypothetical protein